MPEKRTILDIEVPAEATDYRSLSAEELDGVYAAAIAAAKPLRTKDEATLTDEDVDSLSALAEIITNVRDAREYQKIRAEDLARSGDVFSAVDSEAAAAESAAQAPAEPAAAPRVADVARTDPASVVPTADNGTQTSYGRLIPAQDVPGYTGSDNEDGMAQVAAIVEKRLAAFAGRNGGYARSSVAVFQREFPKELRQMGLKDDLADQSLLEYAANQTRLPGGSVVDSVTQQLKGGKSLTAAAGWCAPSQTVYDLFELEARTGLVDLPEIQVSRGGLRFTPGPAFSDIFAGTGYFHQTEAQVIANTTKPCMVVPCPSFTDVRLEVEGVCITGAILQSRGYPEAVARFVRGAMSVHTHKLNQFVIAQMVAGSTTVDLSPAPIATSAVADDTSATTVLLSTIEMAVVDYRYRHRMPENAVLEAVFPIWALAVLRADLSRRTGVQLMSITDEFLIGQMRERGIRPQFVYDWQDSFAGLANSPGGASALQQFPQELEFLLYAPGTFVRGSADVITLETVYDAANLALNQFTALFTEEAVLVAKLGHDARRYVVPFCPTGATSATVAINCS